MSQNALIIHPSLHPSHLLFISVTSLEVTSAETRSSWIRGPEEVPITQTQPTSPVAYISHMKNYTWFLCKWFSLFSWKWMNQYCSMTHTDSESFFSCHRCWLASSLLQNPKHETWKIKHYISINIYNQLPDKQEEILCKFTSGFPKLPDCEFSATPKHFLFQVYNLWIVNQYSANVLAYFCVCFLDFCCSTWSQSMNFVEELAEVDVRRNFPFLSHLQLLR